VQNSYFLIGGPLGGAVGTSSLWAGAARKKETSYCRLYVAREPASSFRFEGFTAKNSDTDFRKSDSIFDFRFSIQSNRQSVPGRWVRGPLVPRVCSIINWTKALELVTPAAKQQKKCFLTFFEPLLRHYFILEKFLIRVGLTWAILKY
jgi:hypothetical protein